MRVSIVYDGLCPVCNHVVRAARLQARSGELELIDVRTQSVSDIQGHDLREVDFDEGFAVAVDRTIYLGAEGAHALALLTEPTGLLFRVFRLLNGSPGMSRFWYPILKAGRGLLLRLMAVPKINENRHSGSKKQG